jgi:hypothetical protein
VSLRCRKVETFYLVCDRCNHEGPLALSVEGALDRARAEGFVEGVCSVCRAGTCACGNEDVMQGLGSACDVSCGRPA